MVKYSWLPKLAAVGLGCVVAGCGGSARQGQVRTTPPPPPPPVTAEVKPVQAPLPPPVDPVQTLIDESQRLYEQGKRDLDLGHLEQARAAFNRAIDVLLSAPGGARTEPRLRAQFDRLVDRISALEVAALATGDGFAEKPTEPASLDQLLAMSDTLTDAVPTRAVAATVQTDLAETEHDIPIPQNEKVLAYIELFQGRLRSFIQDGLDRGGQYLPMIQNVFRAEGLPLDLAYVPLIESAFKTNALSVKSARGVWQFVHATALENGLRHDWYIDERSDPEKATKAAAKYLKTLSRIFDGDWHLALASYNGGPGRVQRAMKRTGRDDFWELSSNKRWLPRETREYVPMILAAMVIARNPAQYGFSFTPSSPLPRETVNVSGPLDLRRVAEWTGDAGGHDRAAEPGASPLDDARARCGVFAQGAGGDGRHAGKAAQRDAGIRARRAQLAYGEIWRDAAHHRTQAARQPRRSGRGQLPVGQGARAPRAEADHPARTRDTDGLAARSADAAARVATHRRARVARLDAGHAARSPKWSAVSTR